MYRLWKKETYETYKTLGIVCAVIDTTFAQASLISAVCIACERFHAIFRPLRHRTLSLKACFIIIATIWTLDLLVSAVFNTAKYLISDKAAIYAWMSFPLLFLFIVFLCNVGIYRTFHKRKVSSQQGNRPSQTQRLTKTLLFNIFYVKSITTPKDV